MEPLRAGTASENGMMVEKQRGGCLTAALVVFALLTVFAGVSNLLFSNRIAAAYPNGPTWTKQAVLGLGLLSFVAVAALFLLWKWRRLGLYLYVAVGLIVFAI